MTRGMLQTSPKRSLPERNDSEFLACRREAPARNIHLIRMFVYNDASFKGACSDIAGTTHGMIIVVACYSSSEYVASSVVSPDPCSKHL